MILSDESGLLLIFDHLWGAVVPAGQPTLQQLRELYRLQRQSPATKVFGIVGNPVSHR